MSWLAIEIPVARAQLAALEDLLFEHGALALSLVTADAADEVLEPDPGTAPVWRANRVQAILPLDADVAGLRRAITNLNPGLLEHAEIDFVEEGAWHGGGEQAPVDRVFAGRLGLRPKAARGSASDEGVTDVYLDAGLAFGSGSHPTTQLCLEAVARIVQPGDRVLDFGCGSGVLGLAAARLGARVVCVDHDEQALVATRDNALYNGIGLDEIAIIGVDEWQKRDPAQRFDLVVANILAGPLTALARELQAALRPGGIMVLSGILAEQADALARAYDAIEFSEPETDAGWTRLTGYKRGG